MRRAAAVFAAVAIGAIGGIAIESGATAKQGPSALLQVEKKQLQTLERICDAVGGKRCR